MKNPLKNLIMTILVILVALATVSCKKNKVKKIAVDTQFAVSLFNDTISIKDILHDMDSTTNSWLRVRNDSIFAFYADSINGALKASDFLGDIPNVDFNTVTGFNMPPFDPLNNHDTIINVDKFMTVPFHYDGFTIDNVILRSGTMSLDFTVEPMIEQLKQIEVYSDQILSPEGETLKLIIDYSRDGAVVDLAGYQIVPDNDTVAFSANIMIHVDSGIYPGGDYQCVLEGGLTNVKFKTVYAIVTKALDTTYIDRTDIDFGINGLSGSAHLPVPKILLTYRNTFGLSATSDVSKLEFYSSRTGLVTNLLAADHWIETVEPTNGQFRSKRIGNFVDEIDVLAGYTNLDFDVTLNMAMPGEMISISDTSSVDIIADVEMPLSFRISELNYNDTIDISFGEDVNVQNYLDEIDFTIDYTNHIPLQVTMQGVFMKNGHVIDSLFDGGGTILYNEPGSIEAIITDRKLKNVLRANKMILRLGVTTSFQTDPVYLLESNNIVLRMKMLTKSSEIELDDVL